ncbi:MAG: signal peptidase I [Kiritimatiellae bacterium]|nr:signal peptidase I [Kiritimatiellia bacterium]
MSSQVADTNSPLGRMIWGRRPRRTLVRALALAIVTYVVFTGPVFPVRLAGISMEPTLRDGEIRWVNRWAFWFRDPRPGEIVLIRPQARGRLLYVKRVLATPGERMRFVDGRLEINGQHVPEPYVVDAERWNTREYLLQPDEFYVSGDNRGQPMEAHTTFVAPRPMIIGALWSPRGAIRSLP